MDRKHILAFLNPQITAKLPDGHEIPAWDPSQDLVKPWKASLSLQMLMQAALPYWIDERPAVAVRNHQLQPSQILMKSTITRRRFLETKSLACAILGLNS